MSPDWKRKLTSRKFWLTICNFVGMLMLYLGSSGEQVERLTALIMAGAGVIAYIVAEGMADAKGAEANAELVYEITDEEETPEAEG